MSEHEINPLSILFNVKMWIISVEKRKPGNNFHGSKLQTCVFSSFFSSFFSFSPLYSFTLCKCVNRLLSLSVEKVLMNNGQIIWCVIISIRVYPWTHLMLFMKEMREEGKWRVREKKIAVKRLMSLLSVDYMVG